MQKIIGLICAATLLQGCQARKPSQTQDAASNAATEQHARTEARQNAIDAQRQVDLLMKQAAAERQGSKTADAPRKP